MKVKTKHHIMTPKNARSFTIIPGREGVTPTELHGKIIALDLGTHMIFTGSTVTVNKKPYKVNHITRSIISNKLVYTLTSDYLTKSSMFVMPMLTGNRRLFMFDSLFVNCFIGIKDYENKIVLVYRFSGDTTFLKFENALQKFPTFVDTFDPSPYFVAFVFDIPERYMDNYVHFLNGKYSKFSPDYKESILYFHGFDAEGELGQILFRSPEKKERLEMQLDVELDEDAELYSRPDEKEVFNPEIYI
tara:strand:+ start:2663 stop:3400 length:738 start_codon:yes stop_codon:yes gene_type:complete